MILIYHYTGASSVSGIYNFMRVLVASYLFMTGFGHFIFFMKKTDFGVMRVAKVLVRLNFFTVVLAYLMNSSYQAYYFSPLVSLWFGVIWVTMAVKSSMNSLPWFMFTKLSVANILSSLVLIIPGFFEETSKAIAVLTGTNWDTHEWMFRYGLDRYIVFIGMAIAYATILGKDYIASISEDKFRRILKYAWPIGSVLALIYFVYEFRTDKFSYNAAQPFISFIPICVYIVLRNISESARKNTSWFYCFFGRISLETFIVQFHLWLALDTKGLLVVVPQSWFTNFIITSYLFVYISNLLANVTNSLTEVCVGQEATLVRRAVAFCVGTLILNHLPL